MQLASKWDDPSFPLSVLSEFKLPEPYSIYRAEEIFEVDRMGLMGSKTIVWETDRFLAGSEVRRI